MSCTRPRLLVFAAVLLAALGVEGAQQERSVSERLVRVSPEFAVVLSEGRIFVEGRPLEGESLAEFATRICRDEKTAAGVRAALKPGAAAPVQRIAYDDLSKETQLAAMRALFPADIRSADGWVHIATTEEAVSVIGAWFTGKPALGTAIAQQNGLGEATLIPRGARIRIPEALLGPAFKEAPAIEDEEPVTLEFGEDAKGKFALYRLRKGEALYSAVVVRFTGRLHAEDVILLALKIAERSGIEDVHGIPIGYPVKIPIEHLAADYLPQDDPKAQERMRERAETAQFAPPALKGSLAGVRIILDAGHGGRDTGTLHHGVWESTYVYDVVCRLRQFLIEKTRAEVILITKEPAIGWEVQNRDVLKDHRSRVLLTDPPYRLEDPVVGVNLRWYLANSWLRRPGKDKKPVRPERTVFISIHADSLHPSVRGAMAYVPGERFLREQYGKKGTVYAKYREYREEPSVVFNKKERVSSEGVSTLLAARLLMAIREEGLPVHQFSPIRTHVIRGGREWVPAVLRYTRVPNRVLLEISNLSNEEDRKMTLTRKFRQSMAEGVGKGIIEFFSNPAVPVKQTETASLKGVPAAQTLQPARAVPSKEPTKLEGVPAVGKPEEKPEIQGPWPPVVGPWPLSATPGPRKGPELTPGPGAPTSNFREKTTNREAGGH